MHNFRERLKQIFDQSRQLDLELSTIEDNIVSNGSTDRRLTPRFNVVKMLNGVGTAVEFGLTMQEALRSLNGRYQNRIRYEQEITFKIVPQ